MRPNVPHFVVTVSDALVVGGQFYANSTMQHTLWSLVQEHYFGNLITNNMMPTVGIWLFQHVHHVALLANQGPQALAPECEYYEFVFQYFHSHLAGIQLTLKTPRTASICGP